MQKAELAFTDAVKDGVFTFDVKDGKKLTKEDLLKLAEVNVRGWEIDVTGDIEGLNLAIGKRDTGKAFDFTFTASKGDSNLTANLQVKLVDSTSVPEPEPKPEPETKYFMVTFVDGIVGTKDETQKVAEGKAVAKPADPTYEGWEFAGWYTSADFKELYDFKAPVTTDITLYAGWRKAGSDEVAEPEKTEKPEGQKPADKKSDGKALPQTGDDSVLPMAAVAGAGVAAVVAGAAAMKRRKQE